MRTAAFLRYLCLIKNNNYLPTCLYFLRLPQHGFAPCACSPPYSHHRLEVPPAMWPAALVCVRRIFRVFSSFDAMSPRHESIA